MANKSIRSAKGTFVFPHLHAPDTKFNAKGVYQTKLNCSAEDSVAQRAQIDEAHAAVVAAAEKELAEKKAAAPQNKQLQKQEVKVNDVPYIEEEDGSFTFKYSMKAEVTRKKDNKTFTLSPALFDSKGVKLPKGTKIGGGSVGYVAYQIFPYATPQGVGVKLALDAVMITELKTWSGASASQFGFEAEEGFSADDLPEEAAPVAADEVDETDETAEETTDAPAAKVDF